MNQVPSSFCLPIFPAGAALDGSSVKVQPMMESEWNFPSVIEPMLPLWMLTTFPLRVMELSDGE